IPTSVISTVNSVLCTETAQQPSSRHHSVSPSLFPSALPCQRNHPCLTTNHPRAAISSPVPLPSPLLVQLLCRLAPFQRSTLKAAKRSMLHSSAAVDGDLERR